MTSAESASQLFAELAEQVRSSALSALPEGYANRRAHWIEVARTLDHASLLSALEPDSQRLSSPDFTLLNWGWNAATAELLKPPGEG